MHSLDACFACLWKWRISSQLDDWSSKTLAWLSNSACLLACLLAYVLNPPPLACNGALSLYLCNLFLGRGHDTFLLQITCKKARKWTFSWLDSKQYGWFALFQLAKTPPPVSCCWFQSGINEQWIHTRVHNEISAGSVFLNLKNV